jgi:voltage-gated potassium channel
MDAIGKESEGSGTMTTEPYGPRLATWTRWTEWPLAGAALAFLALYAWSVIADLPASGDGGVEFWLTLIWVLFFVDYVVSLSLARQRGQWFVRHIHDLLIVALPFLRPLRLLRLVTLVSVLQRTAGSAFRGRVTIYVVSAAALLVLVSGIAILDAEQNADGANITTIGDAFWWAFVTITTVGYGDFYPVTLSGRLIAVGLMIAGIALVGSVTATFASWFVERVRSQTPEPSRPDLTDR